MITLLIITYWLAVAALSVYGLLGLYTLWQYWRHRHQTFPCPPFPTAPPPVTIQLPIYNEKYVIEQLIDTAVALDYPRDRLQIQIIDDSTDNTTDIAARKVNVYRQQGINISLIHRSQRTGYKAGALAHALPGATGDYIAVFDADFQPQPDFLQHTIPHFLENEQLGMIQTRWGHLNQSHSALTAAQAIAIDKHFAMEQAVRHRANLFPKFNGAGGIWRRQCLQNAGGWQQDTICEDLCLSTRALLKGWQFRFLDRVISPAEIPTAITAYKSQQARWAKGSSQCLLKYSRPILAAPNHSFTAKVYALLSMSAYMTHLLVIIILLLQIPLIIIDYQVSSWILVFTLAGLGQPLLFILGQQVSYSDWLRRLRHFPTLLFLAVGLAPTNTRAILEAFNGRHHPFIRTPKQGTPRQGVSAYTTPAYKLPFDWLVIVELFLGAYALVGIILALQAGNIGPIFFLASCVFGFSYVTFLSFQEQIGWLFTSEKTHSLTPKKQQASPK